MLYIAAFFAIYAGTSSAAAAEFVQINRARSINHDTAEDQVPESGISSGELDLSSFSPAEIRGEVAVGGYSCGYGNDDCPNLTTCCGDTCWFLGTMGNCAPPSCNCKNQYDLCVDQCGTFGFTHCINGHCGYNPTWGESDLSSLSHIESGIGSGEKDLMSYSLAEQRGEVAVAGYSCAKPNGWGVIKEDRCPPWTTCCGTTCWFLGWMGSCTDIAKDESVEARIGSGEKDLMRYSLAEQRGEVAIAGIKCTDICDCPVYAECTGCMRCPAFTSCCGDTCWVLGNWGSCADVEARIGSGKKDLTSLSSPNLVLGQYNGIANVFAAVGIVFLLYNAMKFVSKKTHPSTKFKEIEEDV